MQFILMNPLMFHFLILTKLELTKLSISYDAVIVNLQEYHICHTELVLVSHIIKKMDYLTENPFLFAYCSI